MGAIFRREIKSYFTSPIGYIFLAAFYAYAGIMFASGSLESGYTKLDAVFGSLLIIVVVLVPVLTMRTMSEDKRTKTDQCLLTAPVSLPGIVLGKFFAAYLIYLIAIAITGVFAIVVSAFGTPDWNVVVGNIVGLALVGAAYIAIGVFCSACTENQIVSVVMSFIVLLALTFMTTIASLIPTIESSPEYSTARLVGTICVCTVVAAAVGGLCLYKLPKLACLFVGLGVDIVLVPCGYFYYKIPTIANTALTKISFGERYYSFTYGLFDFSNVIFFISAAAAFIFLTVRVLEKRRWG